MPIRISSSVGYTTLVSLLFIYMIPIDCKVIDFFLILVLYSLDFFYSVDALVQISLFVIEVKIQ